MQRWKILAGICLEVLSFLISILVLLFVIPKLLGFFWPFAVSWIIAALASPLCSYLVRHLKLTQKWASALIILMVILILVIIGYLFISTTGKELILLLSDVSGYYTVFKDLTNNTAAELEGLVSPFAPDLGALIGNISQSIVRQTGTFANQIAPSAVKLLGQAAFNLTNGFIGVIVTILSAYIFIADRDKLESFVLKMLPDGEKQKMMDIRSRLIGALEGFFIAQFKIMAIIFFILLSGFLVLRNPYALLLALIITILDLLPFIGTGTVLIPWALLLFVKHDFRQGAFLLILYLTCLFGRQLLQPKIIGDSVGLDTLSTLVLIYTGYKLNGVRGILIALFVGIVLTTFYHLGLFDHKAERIRKLWESYRHCEDSC